MEVCKLNIKKLITKALRLGDSSRNLILTVSFVIFLSLQTNARTAPQ